MKIIGTILFILWSSIALTQKEVEFNVSCSEDSVAFASPFKINLVLKITGEYQHIRWPEFEIDAPIGKNFLIWDKTRKQERTNNDSTQKRTYITQELTVAGIHTGYVPFEPINIEVDGQTFESNATLIKIGTYDVDTTQAIHPIKPIYYPNKTKHSSWIAQNWWWVLFLVIGLMLLLWLLLRKKAPKEKTQPSVQPLPISTYEKYVGQLQQTMELELWKKGKVKEHYIHITDITRAFYEEKYHVSTFEKTNKELEQLTETLPINPPLKEKLYALFRTSEFVKFAKQSPPEQEIQKHQNTVQELLKEAQKKGSET